jgi:hypothetical protein
LSSSRKIKRQRPAGKQPSRRRKRKNARNRRSSRRARPKMTQRRVRKERWRTSSIGSYRGSEKSGHDTIGRSSARDQILRKRKLRSRPQRKT